MKQIIMMIALTFMVMASSTIEARYCGKVDGKKIKTYGGLSCKKARSVFKAFNKGHIPKGWTCGQSVKGCGMGHKGFHFS